MLPCGCSQGLESSDDEEEDTHTARFPVDSVASSEITSRLDASEPAVDDSSVGAVCPEDEDVYSLWAEEKLLGHSGALSRVRFR